MCGAHRCRARSAHRTDSDNRQENRRIFESVRGFEDRAAAQPKRERGMTAAMSRTAMTIAASSLLIALLTAPAAVDSVNPSTPVTLQTTVGSPAPAIRIAPIAAEEAASP